VSLEVKPLPRGRHGLSREQVVDDQRLRLVRAMAEAMADQGYAATSVADILRRARVSRETFYELFSSKEDCFMSAFDQAYGHILTAIAPVADADGRPPIERFSSVLGEYLDALASDPNAARVFLVEVYAAGPQALKRRLALQRELVDAIASRLGASDEEEHFAVEALVAAIVSMVTARLAVGDAAGLRDLQQPIVTLAERLIVVQAAT
jgi:AcrR family transcriptional regulator